VPDSFLHATLQAAALRIQAAIGSVAERLADALAQLAQPSVNMSRQELARLQDELQRKLAVFNLEFASHLRERIEAEGAPRRESRRTLASTSWEALSLVADEEVDERVSAERLSMDIAHDCEWELRELEGYVSALLPLGHGETRNPLRPEVVARALLKAIDAVTPEPAYRKLLGREFGRALAPTMRGCYAEIIAELRDKGVRNSGLAVRMVQGPGNDLPREALREAGGYQTSGFRSSGYGSGAPGLGPDSHSGISRSGYAGSGSPGYAGSGSPGYAGSGSPGYAGSGSPGSSFGGSRAGGLHGAADAQMLDVLRRLAFATPSGATAPGPYGGAAAPDGGPGAAAPGAAAGAGGPPLSGLMAVNLIRQHREELVRASPGALDHMVIDIVASMFDHLLSDNKVPPQLARQIARLQMPVLRAALRDVNFFNSRRHPVRRFVNRIASLAAAYEDLESGPGKDFIERVRELVQEIVEGDFDQMDLYESKLQAIEALIQEQSGRDVGPHAQAAGLLDGKETQLRIQQRYTITLRSQLEPLGLPDYLRDFLSQVWSQVQVQVSRPGYGPELAERLHRTAADLVWSVQPKGEPSQRKAFLLKLPQLMKNLNEGLALIRWPEAARKDFFAKLLPAHAGSLKAPPLSDFEQRQLKFKLEQVGKVQIPTEHDLSPSAAAMLPPAEEHAAPLQFTPEEAQRIGLVEEAAVDWDGVVDIDLDEPAPASTGSPEVDIAIEAMQQAEGVAPTHGPQLMQHLQTGVAYRMYLENRWQRVRLNWVSPGRAFFVFTHGKAHEKTVSMTSRMLRRLCETERLRAYEHAELLERATSRARKQLAQLTASRQATLAQRA